jgi:hypothetical protein
MTQAGREGDRERGRETGRREGEGGRQGGGMVRETGLEMETWMVREADGVRG